MAVIIFPDDTFKCFWDEDSDSLKLRKEYMDDQPLWELEDSRALSRWKAWVIPEAKEKGYSVNIYGTQVAAKFNFWSYFYEEEYFYGPVMFTHLHPGRKMNNKLNKLPDYSIRRLAKAFRDVRNEEKKWMELKN